MQELRKGLAERQHKGRLALMLRLAGIKPGRIGAHLICLVKERDIERAGFHLDGIARELGLE